MRTPFRLRSALDATDIQFDPNKVQVITIWVKEMMKKASYS